MSIIETIQNFVPNDVQLAQLFDNVQEYAQLYLLAKQRQKGCDGMGEVATLRDEFVFILEGMIKYCQEKGYLTGDVSFNVDSISLSLRRI
jgi:hypothetical protein